MKYIGYILLSFLLCSAVAAGDFFAGGGANYTLFHNKPIFDLYGGYRLSPSFGVETSFQYAFPYARNKYLGIPFPLYPIYGYDDTRTSWLKCMGSLRIYSDINKNNFFILSAGYIHLIRQNPITDGYRTTFKDGFCYGFGFISVYDLTEHFRLYFGSKLEFQLYTQKYFNQDATCSINIGAEWYSKERPDSIFY